MIFTRRGKFGIDSIKNSQGSIMNKYVPGSGVGATSIFARRAKLYRSPPKIAEAASSTNAPSLNIIAAYLRNYMVEFRNTDFWGYTMDGSNIYITDGGEDVFDTGMFITPWLLSGDRYDISSTSSGSYPYAIQYDTITETVVDTDLKYISLGYIPEPDTDNPQIDQSLHPLTVMCYRESGPVGWQNGGEIGADGSGDAIHGYVYENTLVNGFTVYAGYRQVYNANDPTICQLVILLGHSSWGSVFGPVTIISNNSDKQYCQFVMYAGEGSKNILAVNVLLSKDLDHDDSPISDSELQSIVSNYITRIKESCSL
jgi:hypothetical protein